MRLQLPDSYNNFMHDFQRSHPRFLAAERWLWRWPRRARHPLGSYRDWRHWRSRPKAGDKVYYHYDLLTVSGHGESEDELTFAEGGRGSWMSCCSWEDPRDDAGRQRTLAGNVRESLRLLGKAQERHGRLRGSVMFLTGLSEGQLKELGGLGTSEPEE